jgi:membrane fusion protein, copper/silver efflux system
MKKTVYAVLLLLVISGAFVLGAWFTQQTATAKSNGVTRRILYYVDPMHPAYKSDKPGIAPDCGMELMPVYEDGGMGGSGGASGMPPGTVNVSPDNQQLIGVRVATVGKAHANRTVRTVGRITQDENRVYRILAGADGWIREIHGGTTGSMVEKDQLLAVVYNRDFLPAEQALFYALNLMDRSMKEGMANTEQIAAATNQLQAAEDNLRFLGMGDLQIKEIARTRKLTREFAVRAPITGVVLSRSAFPDVRFDRGAELYRLVDLSRVWILVDLFENEAKYFQPGTQAQVTVPHQRQAYAARVSDILPQFDPATRTLKVRLEMENPASLLRPDMFVDVELPIRLPSTMSVPADAVLDSGIRKTVFVDRGAGVFEPRRVETGERLGDRVEIVKGLTTGERIVVSGTFLLDSESRLKLAAAGIYGTTSKDPVCGMDVDEGKARAAGLTSEYREKTYYFCSDGDKQQFDKEPARYAMKAAHSEDAHTMHDHTGLAYESHDHGGHQPSSMRN